MYVFAEHGSLSNINLQKELDFLKAKSHVEKTKLQQLRKDFDLYKLYGIGRDRDYKDSCRSDRCATCLYGQCKPNTALQIFSAPAFRSLMTQHLLLHYPVPQPYAKGRGWQKVILVLPSKQGHLSKTEGIQNRKKGQGLGEMWHIIEGILVFTGSQSVPARETAPAGSSSLKICLETGYKHGNKGQSCSGKQGL